MSERKAQRLSETSSATEVDGHDLLRYSPLIDAEHLFALISSAPESGNAVADVRELRIDLLGIFETDELESLAPEGQRWAELLTDCNYPLTYLGGLLQQVAHRGKEVERWTNYGLTDLLGKLLRAGEIREEDYERLAPHAVEADGTVAVHSIRQAQITSLAAMLDGLYPNVHKGNIEGGWENALTPEEVDLLVLVAFIHDLGEYGVGDITYDIKQQLGEDHEMLEAPAALQNLDAALNQIADVPEWMKKLSKIAYLRVATKLSDEKIEELEEELDLHLDAAEIPPEYSNYAMFAEDYTRWNLLRQRFKLYERYGYLVTAKHALQEVLLTESSREKAKATELLLDMPLLLTEEEKEATPWMDRRELEYLLYISNARRKRQFADLDIKYWEAYNYGLSKVAKKIWDRDRFSAWQGFINRARGGRGPSLNFRRVILALNVLRNQVKYIVEEYKQGSGSARYFGAPLVLDSISMLAPLNREAANEFQDALEVIRELSYIKERIIEAPMSPILREVDPRLLRFVVTSELHSVIPWTPRQKATLRRWEEIFERAKEYGIPGGDTMLEHWNEIWDAEKSTDKIKHLEYLLPEVLRFSQIRKAVLDEIALFSNREALEKLLSYGESITEVWDYGGGGRGTLHLVPSVRPAEANIRLIRRLYEQAKEILDEGAFRAFLRIVFLAEDKLAPIKTPHSQQKTATVDEWLSFDVYTLVEVLPATFSAFEERVLELYPELH